eukprot:6206535-Pleurochrysis_carterae.AAC.2
MIAFVCQQLHSLPLHMDGVASMITRACTHTCACAHEWIRARALAHVRPAAVCCCDAGTPVQHAVVTVSTAPAFAPPPLPRTSLQETNKQGAWYTSAFSPILAPLRPMGVWTSFLGMHEADSHHEVPTPNNAAR